MKIEVTTNKSNYKPIVLRRAIIICWALIICCAVITFFGGDFFKVIYNEPNFVKFCNYVDLHIWPKIMLGCISSLISYSLFYLAICKKLWFSKRDLIIVLITVPICVVLRIYASLYNIGIVSLLTNVLQCFIVPFFLERTDRPLRWFIPIYAIGNILNFAFQIISAFAKQISHVYIPSSYLIASISIIDVYIMLALYYLYANALKYKDKEVRRMSWLWDWLFGKSESTLLKMKSTRLNNIAKMQAEINAIDAELEKRNKQHETK